MFSFEHIPKTPSELYLEGVLARKKPRGPAVLLAVRRTYSGNVQIWVEANLVKAYRKAHVKAYWYAVQKQALPPTNNWQRQLAAAVLGGFMEMKAGHYAPARFIYRHAEYAHALHFYKQTLYPRRRLWNKLP